jgi:hypothetical protein
MSPLVPSAVTLLAVNGAALSVWTVEELYFRRGPVSDIAMALALSMAAIVALIALLRMILGSQLTERTLRFLVLVAGSYLLLRLPANSGWLPSSNSLVRLGLALAAAGLLGAFLLSRDGFWRRLQRAIVFACVAFICTPLVFQMVSARSIRWEPVRPMATGIANEPRNKVILLLDEMSDTAAGPVVDVLKSAELIIATKSLKSAGPNTLQVIPAMFDGRDFSQARACARSAVCSGSQVLDFSAVRSSRSDVDVVGLFHPYCEMQGLRYCHVEPMGHEHGNAFRSLANLYLSKLGRPLTDTTVADEQEHHLTERLVGRQIDSIWRAPFWRQGGVLFAHVALPHPPGVPPRQNLDEDYARNVQRAATLVQQLITRLRGSFGDDFALMITSDHPLRDFWCSSPYYKGTDCNVRAEFRSPLVPLIVVSPRPVPVPTIESNAQIFGWL